MQGKYTNILQMNDRISGFRGNHSYCREPFPWLCMFLTENSISKCPTRVKTAHLQRLEEHFGTYFPIRLPMIPAQLTCQYLYLFWIPISCYHGSSCSSCGQAKLRQLYHFKNITIHSQISQHTVCPQAPTPPPPHIYKITKPMRKCVYRICIEALCVHPRASRAALF